MKYVLDSRKKNMIKNVQIFNLLEKMKENGAYFSLHYSFKTDTLLKYEIMPKFWIFSIVQNFY